MHHVVLVLWLFLNVNGFKYEKFLLIRLIIMFVLVLYFQTRKKHFIFLEIDISIKTINFKYLYTMEKSKRLKFLEIKKYGYSESKWVKYRWKGTYEG